MDYRLNFDKNLSLPDRVLRIVIGMVLLMLIYNNTITGLWSLVAIIFALSQFVEGILGY